MMKALITLEISLPDPDLEVEMLLAMLKHHREAVPFGNGIQLRIDTYPIQASRDRIAYEAQMKEVKFV